MDNFLARDRYQGYAGTPVDHAACRTSTSYPNLGFHSEPHFPRQGRRVFRWKPPFACNIVRPGRTYLRRLIDLKQKMKTAQAQGI